MERESIRVTRSVSIPLSEIDLRFSRSSGPGGQHAQKTETRVEALFDVEGSTALTSRQKQRVLRKAGPGATRRRPGRAEPDTEPRARDRAAGRAALPRLCASRGGAWRRSRARPRSRDGSSRSAAARR